MAGQQGAQEKTEKPTAKRRSKAREQGQVVKSQELNNVVVLLAGMTSIYILGGYVYQNLVGLMRHIFGSLGVFHLTDSSIQGLTGQIGTHFLKTAGPIWGVVFLFAVLINLAQVGFLYAPKRLKPSMDKINPIKGLKKFVSLRLLVDLAKNIAKLVTVATAAYLTIESELANIPKLGDMGLEAIILYIISVCFKIFWHCIIAMVVIAALDWMYQKYDHEKNLKMSKQEVKDEGKQTEGDPQVKSRIRTLQREQARKRMMAEVPMADVVVTNPTHLAVALAYKMQEMEAPEVVAKGANKVAERIKEIARENDIPIIEDKPLARALFRQVEVGQSIPPDMFEATAAILAHVYRTKNRQDEILKNTRR